MIIPEVIHSVSWQADFHENFLRVSYMKQDLIERAIVSFQDIKEYALAKRTVLSWHYPSSTGAFIASSESVWNLQGKSDSLKNYWLSHREMSSSETPFFLLLSSLKSSVHDQYLNCGHS